MPVVSIDPPSPYAPVSAWHTFLAVLLRGDQTDPDIREATRRARLTIDRLTTGPMPPFDGTT